MSNPLASPRTRSSYVAAEAGVDWDEAQLESTELEQQPAVEHERRGLFRRRRAVVAAEAVEDDVLDTGADDDADAEPDQSDEYEAQPFSDEPVYTEAAADSQVWSYVETTDDPEVEHPLEDQVAVEDDLELEPVAQFDDQVEDEPQVTHERRGLFRRRKAVSVAESTFDEEASASDDADEPLAVEDDGFENVPMYPETTYSSSWDASEPEVAAPEELESDFAEPEPSEPETEVEEPDYGVAAQIEVYAVAEDSEVEANDEPGAAEEADEVDEAATAEELEPDAVEEFALEVVDEPFESDHDDTQPFDVPVTSLQDEPVVSRKRNGNSSSRGRKVVGLKVGASQIAAAVVTGSGDRPALVDIARRPLEHGVVVDGELRDPEALAHALKTFFKDHGLPAKNVRLGISSSRVGVRSFDIVGIEDEERFDNAVRFKAHEVLPVAANESVLDYRVVEERYTESGEVARHVLLVVAPRDQVEPYIEACRTAGLRLAGVDLESFGLLRAFVPPLGSRSRSEDSATVVVAIGHEASTLLVAGGGVCEFTRVFDWGGGALQSAIAEELEVPLMEAATILTHLSLSGPGRHLDSLDSDTRSRALEAVRTKLTPFARELVSSLQFYQTQPESLGIKEILITGGTSHLEGLADVLHQMIGVSVSVGDPLARVTVQTEIPVALDATIGSLAVPIGLAIEDESTRSVNLLPKESRQARKSPDALAVALPVGAAVLLAALAFLFMQASSTVGDRQGELDAVRAEIAKLPEPTRPNIDPALAGEQAQRATAVAQVLGGRLSWERVLGDVARVLPTGVSLTELSATAPQPTTPEPAATTTEETSSTSSTPPPAPAATTPSAPTGVIVTGYAFDYESIARALARLQAIPSLANAQLQSAVPANLGTKRVIEFTIVADLATHRRCPVTGKLSNRSAVALGCAMFAVALVALWFLVVSPERSQAKSLAADVAAAQAELDQKKAALANPSAAVTVRTSDVFRLAKALPEDENVAGAILDVNRLAKKHKLTLEGFQPTAVVPVTGYYAQPLTVTVQGRFGDVSKFLADLRNLVRVKHGRLSVQGRLYSVSEVRLGKPDGEIKFPVVRAGVLLNAFGFMPGVPATTTPTTPETDSTTPSTDGTSAAGATP